MADHVVVMKDGVIEQQGSPIALYDKPVNRFVAGFIGSPAMNFIPAEVAEDGRHVSLRFAGGTATGSIPLLQPLQPASRITVGIRPEHIRFTAPPDAQFRLPVAAIETTGSATFITTATAPEVVLVTQGRSMLKAGEELDFAVDPAALHLFDETTGMRI